MLHRLRSVFLLVFHLCNWQLDSQVCLAAISYSFLPGITEYYQVLPSIRRYYQVNLFFSQIEDWTGTHLEARSCSLPAVPEIRGLYSWHCWIQIRSDFLPMLDCHGQSSKSRSGPNGSYQEGFHNVLQCRKSHFSEDYNTSDSRHTTWWSNTIHL